MNQNHKQVPESGGAQGARATADQRSEPRCNQPPRYAIHMVDRLVSGAHKPTDDPTGGYHGRTLAGKHFLKKGCFSSGSTN